MKLSLLIVDDEVLIRKSLSKVFRARACTVETASTGAEGLERAAAVRPQVMILDMRLPDTDGLTVLKRARQIDPLLQVIVITAYGDVDSAVEAMKLGATDFVRKPYELDEIALAVESAAAAFAREAELDAFRRPARERIHAQEILGDSPAMVVVRELVAKVASSENVGPSLETEASFPAPEFESLLPQPPSNPALKTERESRIVKKARGMPITAFYHVTVSCESFSSADRHVRGRMSGVACRDAAHTGICSKLAPGTSP